MTHLLEVGLLWNRLHISSFFDSGDLFVYQFALLLILLNVPDLVDLLIHCCNYKLRGTNMKICHVFMSYGMSKSFDYAPVSSSCPKYDRPSLPQLL